MAVQVGSIVEGKVTGITNFGAFIELGGGETGLIHISEVADTYVKDVNDFLKLEQQVKVKVISIDKGKIGLSIKQLEKKRPRQQQQQQQQHRRARPKQSFEDKLSKFLKDSEERQADVKSTFDKRNKRSGF